MNLPAIPIHTLDIPCVYINHIHVTHAPDVNDHSHHYHHPDRTMSVMSTIQTPPPYPVGHSTLGTAATARSAIITTYTSPPPKRFQNLGELPPLGHSSSHCNNVRVYAHQPCPCSSSHTPPFSALTSFSLTLLPPSNPRSASFFQLLRVSTTREITKGAPLYVPRQIEEWKKKPVSEWLTEAGFFRYANHLRENINMGRCKAFIASMRARQQENPSDKDLAGVVEGVLVKYTPMYLYRHFGWDGTGATSWTPHSRFPRPDTTAYTHGFTTRDDGRFCVYTITRRNPQLPDPWFGRIRGVLSQVFF